MPTYRRPIAATAVACMFALVGSQAAGQKPPDTKRGATVDTVHGAAIADPYRWLEDQQAPDTRAWIAAENQFTDAVLKPLPGRERIEKRLTELTRIETVGTPTAAGGRYFFTKRSPNQDLAVLFVREGAAGASQVLVDPHPLSADHSVSVSLMDVAADGRVVAYGERNGGQDEVAVKLLQVDSRKVIDELPRGRYSGVNITPAKTDVYYSRQTQAGPRVFHHVVGQPSARDVEIFGKGFGPEKIIQVDLSGDGRYLLVDVLHGAAAVKSEIYVQDLRAATGLQPIVNDVDALFDPTIGGDTLYLRTNWKAPNSRVLAVDLQHPSRDKWREIIKEQKAPIADVAAAGGRLVVSSFLGVQTHIQIYSVDGVRQREVAFPTLGSTGGLSGRWDSDELFFNFSSWALPNTIYRYAIATGARTEWARVKVPIDSSAFEVKQVWYPSKDGTSIPMFIGAKKGLALDGTHPTFLTGYGGFNLNETPGFSALASFWMENGGVYALPNLRGGGEFGESWHQAGMLAHKQNVFDDFAAAAEYLVANKYTSRAKLAASGGSNGGLLVGALLTEHPDLVRAVVCSYPLLDMLRYQQFLVAGYWVPEYGSSANAEQFKYLRAYSPYHNVKKGCHYPATLFVSGDGDTRVAPLHARKMTALMQWAQGEPDHPILLRYDTKAGHSGGKPVKQIIADNTEELQFLLWQLGALSAGAS
jgi:prolyl oligopeptidase